MTDLLRYLRTVNGKLFEKNQKFPINNFREELTYFMCKR